MQSSSFSFFTFSIKTDKNGDMYYLHGENKWYVEWPFKMSSLKVTIVTKISAGMSDVVSLSVVAVG